MSVRADAESMASRPTRFRSRYGVASRPLKKEEETIYVYVLICPSLPQKLFTLKDKKLFVQKFNDRIIQSFFNRGDNIQYHGGLLSRELGQAPMLTIVGMS